MPVIFTDPDIIQNTKATLGLNESFMIIPLPFAFAYANLAELNPVAAATIFDAVASGINESIAEASPPTATILFTLLLLR